MITPYREDNHENQRSTNIGKRIRAIREARGLSRKELGKMVGLDANRIQQYENGARNPKLELCQRIAEALRVRVEAISEPQLSNELGVMYALFDMEEKYGLHLEKVGEEIHICFKNRPYDTNANLLNKALDDWLYVQTRLKENLKNVNSEKERDELINDYNIWEWRFPV